MPQIQIEFCSTSIYPMIGMTKIYRQLSLSICICPYDFVTWYSYDYLMIYDVSAVLKKALSHPLVFVLAAYGAERKTTDTIVRERVGEARREIGLAEGQKQVL